MSIWRKAVIPAVLFVYLFTVGGQAVRAEDAAGGKKIEQKAPAAEDKAAVKTLAEATARKGLDYLKAQQKENGAWSDESYPALTGLGLWAFAQSDHPDKAAICTNAAKFIAGFVQPNGGIYKPPKGIFRTGGLATYNTAICMTALHAYDPKTYKDIILNARKYVAGSQLQGDSGGGFGYDQPKSGGWAGRPDLSNTAWALRAMRETQDTEDLRLEKEKVDIDWAASVKYVEKLQNQDKDDQQNFGGFGYTAGGARGGTAVGKKGAVKLLGYGSMTYAGLEAMIFAQVDRKDPRVVSALKWASVHWSVDENPGMGAKALYYYYNIMAKSLSVVGGDTIPTDKEPIPWRKQLIEKLAQVQRKDGSWVNKDNTLWEGNPMLVTAYSILALQYAASH